MSPPISQTNLTRRTVLGGLIATSATMTPSLRARTEDSGVVHELQRGDPDASYEGIDVDKAAIRELTDPSRATFEPRSDDFLKMMAATSAEFVGATRANAHDKIAQMLELFDLPFQDQTSGKVIPFCASGLAYITALAYLRLWKHDVNLSRLRGALAEIDHYHFFPSPSVWDMFNVALGKHSWVPANPQTTLPKPGWVVIYDFGKGADHVGLVLSADKYQLHTFECNTSGKVDGSQQNGGVIANRDRDWKHVKGFIRTDLHARV